MELGTHRRFPKGERKAPFGRARRREIPCARRQSIMYCDKIALPHCQMTVYIPDLVADPAVRRPTIVIAPRRRLHAPFHPRERTHCIDLRRNGHECRHRPLPRCPGGFPRADAGYRQRRRRHPPKRRKMARRPESNRPLRFFRRALMPSGCSACIGRKHIGGRRCTSPPPTFARTP